MFDSALVKNDLLETRDTNNGIRDAVRSDDFALVIRFPEADFKHVVSFLDGTVAKSERLKDFEGTALKRF